MLERYGDKAIVVNSKTGRHHSLQPIPLQNAKAQMRVLQAVEKKKEAPSQEKTKSLFYSK